LGNEWHIHTILIWDLDMEDKDFVLLLAAWSEKLGENPV
jgi:hypothetical protein